MLDRLCSKHLVLMGIGHTNAHIVRMWGMQPIPDTDLTCISDHGITTYSGRLPAVLAGQIPEEQMQIDLVRLCAGVGARLIIDAPTGIDHAAQHVLFDDRPAVAYDALSIGIGSVPTTDRVAIEGDQLVKIKPMQTFLQRLSSAVRHVTQRKKEGSIRIVIVGSGVAGIEILLCLPPFLNRLSQRTFSLQLISRSDQITPGSSDGTRKRLQAEIDSRKIPVILGKSVTAVLPDRVVLEDGSSIEADLVLWATGAAAPPLLSKLGLPVDERGFLATDATLRCTSGEPIFAVGDTGTILGEQLPKAGVYAVRQGPVLWENLQRILAGRSLSEYKPQRSFLKLINRGDGHAVGQWKGWSFSGRWVMQWKEFIDSRFMEMYRPQAMPLESDEPMQCHGCGCKLAADVLHQALVASGGLSASTMQIEDAAEIGTGAENRLLASTDFFTAPFTDAYLSGRVAALHAASDIIVSGARVTQALANVVIQEGDSKTQQKALSDFLGGAGREFEAMGASIVGGHTIVGPRMEFGFTVIGSSLGASLVRKQNLRPGDHLYLTKPLGIGILLAAQMRGVCRAADYATLLDAMLCRQHPFAEIVTDLQITAGTDITGFGLAGHLLEMLAGGELTAQLRLSEIPLLPGVETAIAAGIESSLAAANREVASQIQSSSEARSQTVYDVLFDPQTCGGFLFGIAPSTVQTFLSRTTDCGLPQPTCIGTVDRRQAGNKLLSVE